MRLKEKKKWPSYKQGRGKAIVVTAQEFGLQ